MAETLDELVEHLDRRGRETKVVVWAHNSHVGDARATALGARFAVALTKPAPPSASSGRQSNSIPDQTRVSRPATQRATWSSAVGAISAMRRQT